MLEAAPIETQARNFELELRRASPERRLKLQPAFGRLLDDLEESGMRVPVRLRNLHDQLVEEAIEARFDNLPV